MITDDYKAQLQAEHAGSKWGTTGARYAGKQIADQLSNYPYIRTVLEFGCGKGTLTDFLSPQFPGIAFTKYDPGMPGWDDPGLLDRTYDAVISSDVLEHVEPLLLDSTLREIDRAATIVQIHDIACYPTGKLFGEGPYKGHDLHLTIQSPLWWREHFLSVFPENREAHFGWAEKSGKNGPKPRALIVMEAKR